MRHTGQTAVYKQVEHNRISAGGIVKASGTDCKISREELNESVGRIHNLHFSLELVERQTGHSTKVTGDSESGAVMTSACGIGRQIDTLPVHIGGNIGRLPGCAAGCSERTDERQGGIRGCFHGICFLSEKFAYGCREPGGVNDALLDFARLADNECHGQSTHIIGNQSLCAVLRRIPYGGPGKIARSFFPLHLAFIKSYLIYFETF